MQESAIGAGNTAPPDGGASIATDLPSVSQGSGAQIEQPSADVNARPVQGTATTPTQDDPLAGFPPDSELQAAVANKTPFAEMAARIKGAYEPLKTQFSELQTKYTPFEDVLSRFEQPAALNDVLQLHDSLIGWERDAQSGELVPATEKGVEQLATKYPLHADFISADLLNGMTNDPQTGQQITRMDLALKSIASDPARRAETLKLLGAVEPSSISPQWQPTTDELEVIRPELQDVYKKLSYEEREELKLASPEFINRTLEREKFTQDLQSEREQSQQQAQQQRAQREAYVSQQAAAAGEQQVQTQLSGALTTFHNSVVEQCNFIQPLDMASLPQGMTPEQATAMNQQIDASNKAEAAQISMAVIGLVNPQTRPFVLPLLQQIGVVDEKLMKELDASSSGFGDNARNYGELAYKGKLAANGNGFSPDASMTGLGNEATRNLNRMKILANQVAKNLIEKRSEFFSMKATDHNQTLNGVAGTRQMPSGSAYNPTTATPQQPSGWQSKKEIEATYG